MKMEEEIMEEKIAEKCLKVFESCVHGIHYQVAKKFLDLALKRINPDSAVLTDIYNSWELLVEKMEL